MSLSKKTGFTLIEVLVSVALTGVVLGASYAAFQGIMRTQVRLSGTTNIQKNLFYLNEKIVTLVRSGGAIDYEEFFNRRMLGYSNAFDANDIYTFRELSRFGNGENASGRTPLYTCGSPLGGDACITNIVPASPSINLRNKNLAYGQYATLGFNHSSSLGFPHPIKLPPVLESPFDTTGLWELYLIKRLPNNSLERTFFRHVLVPEDPSNPSLCDPDVSRNNCRGKIQMTRLVSCDTMDATGSGNADGIVDAWIPHTDFGGSGCGGISSPSAILSAANGLEWADITGPDINVIFAQFLPQPLKIPTMMSGAGEIAQSPTVRIRIEVKLSDATLRRGNIPNSDNYPRTLIAHIELSDA